MPTIIKILIYNYQQLNKKSVVVMSTYPFVLNVYYFYNKCWYKTNE